MMNFLKKFFLYLAIGALMSMPLYGCEQEGPAEQAGEKAGQTVDQAAEEAEDTMDEAEEEVEEGMEEDEEQTR